MAYTYSDYDDEQYSRAEQYNRLKKHMREVRDQMGPELASLGKSRSTSTLQTYLAELQTKAKQYEKELGIGQNRPRIQRARFG